MAEIATRSSGEALIARVRSDEFIDQVAKALPETVSPQRFTRIAVTAIHEFPDIATCHGPTVLQALLRCAADGLMPDGKEAAIVRFKNTRENRNDAQYMPMIGGFRKIAADHGWMIRTRAVREGDEFDWSEEPPSITHKIGEERGELTHAYAIAEHQDGRRLQRVMNRDQILKRAKLAKTDKVWGQWPDEMWEKTPGRDLFKDLPLGEIDNVRLARMLAQVQVVEQQYADPVTAMYGPEPGELPPPRVAIEAPTTETGPVNDVVDADAAVEDLAGVAETPSSAAAGEPEPTLEDEPELVEPDEFLVPADVEPDPAVAAATEAAHVRIPGGTFKGLEIGAFHHEKGDRAVNWFQWALRNVGGDFGVGAKYGDLQLEPGEFRRALVTYCKVFLPDVLEAAEGEIANIAA